MRKPVSLASAVSTLVLALFLVGTIAQSALAQDAIMYRDRLPEPSELSDILWGNQSTGERTPGRARSIRLTTPAEAPAAETGHDEVSTTPQVEVATTGDDALVTTTAPRAFGFSIHFAFDSAAIEPESRAYLDRVGEMLLSADAAGRGITIVGHTDATGSEQYNVDLSLRRSIAVKRYLEERFGIESARLEVAGLGEAAPLDGHHPADALNRRVEFHPMQ